MVRGALVLVLSLGVFLAACGGPEQVQQEEPEERTRVVEQTVVRTVEATRTIEQPATPIVTPDDEEEERSEERPERVLTSQYRYINAGAYDAAYDLFTEESKQRVSLGQYRNFFESLGFYQITDYSFPYVDTQGNEATVEAAFTVSTPAGEEQYQRVQEMVLTEEGWRVEMREDQVQAFTGMSAAPVPATPSEDEAPSDLPPFPSDPYGDVTCEDVGGGPYSVPPGSPRDADGDGVACEPEE